MVELRNIKGKYRGTVPDWYKDARGDWHPVPNSDKPMPDYMLLPDIVLDILHAIAAPKVKTIFEKHLILDAVGDVVPPFNRHRLFIPKPEISWDRTCQIVSRAFEAFDPELGEKVARILADPSRMKLKQTKTGEAGGNCPGPGYEGSSRATIHYKYDRTINDAVYLAHELGHLLANDFAQESGYKNYKAWMPTSVSEVPAMFTQVILYDYLLNGQIDRTLQDVARQHMAGEMTRDLYIQQIGFAQLAEDYEKQLSQNLGPSWGDFEKAKKRKVDLAELHRHSTASTIAIGIFFSNARHCPEAMHKMFQRGADSDIMDVFVAAGIKTEEALRGFFQRAVKQQARPVIEIYQAFQSQKPAMNLQNAAGVTL